MEEAIGPTIERLRKGEFDRPETTQTTQRRAYRARDPFLEMLRNGEIDGDQFQRAETFERFYHGSEGHDVRVMAYAGDGVSGEVEINRTFYATKLADARKILSVREFRALELMVTSGFDAVLVGRALSKYETRQQAKAYGLAVIQGGLQRLVDLWQTKRETYKPLPDDDDIRRKPPRHA